MDYSDNNSHSNVPDSLNSINTRNIVQHRKVRHQGRGSVSENGTGPPAGRLVPVILSSDRLLFSQEEKDRILTLYNPFNFEIDYKLYTTAPKKYSVDNSEGSVQAQYCVDIPIRRRFIEENVTGFADKFLMKIFSNHACIGKKDVLVFLNTTEDITQIPEISTSGAERSIQTRPAIKNRKLTAHRKIPWAPIALSTVSLAVLMMPLSYIFDYNHRLIAAFIIGVMIGRYWR